MISLVIKTPWINLWHHLDTLEFSELNHVKKLCALIYEELISNVEDRPGHDKRYAIDATKIHNELDWMSLETL